MIINFGFVVNVKSFLMRVLGGTNINFLVWLLDGIRPRLIECRLIWSRLPNFPDQWPGLRVTQVHGQCNIVSGLITTPSSNIVTRNQSGPQSLHNTYNRAVQWWLTLLHFNCARKINHDTVWGWDIFISTCKILMITIGLIWLWLIDLAHSSILSTFRSDPELSWIDWDLSSVTASHSPRPHFYPETLDSAGAWLPGHD